MRHIIEKNALPIKILVSGMTTDIVRVCVNVALLIGNFIPYRSGREENKKL